MGFWLVFLLFLMTGCYVNKAVVDPWSYAPDSSCSYWSPDEKASALACEEPCNAELPCESCELSLAEVLDIALVNNPQTQITWAQARQAAAQYGQSQSTAFPEISLDFFHRQFRSAFLASQVEAGGTGAEAIILTQQTNFGPVAHLTYTLLDFGQRRFTSEAARYLLYFADYTHNQAIQILFETITLSYYNYLYEQKLLEADEANLADAEATLAAADLGFNQGVKNVSDVLQARTQVLLAEIQFSQQHKAVNTAYAILLDNMGLPANACICLQKLPYVDPCTSQLACLDYFLDTAMQCRPDLLAARANVRSNEMSLKAAQRQWTPVLDYSLDFGRTYFTGGFNDRYNFNSVFTVSMPLFTGFNITNTVKKAKARVEEAEGNLKANELNVIKDVTTAHYNIGVANNTLIAANGYLIAASEQYQVAASQYRAGVTTILDLISAQTALFDARATQANAIREWYNSLATLTYSAGILSSSIQIESCICE